MPQLRPFRGLRYAPSAVGNYSAVICPPFDVISTDERARLAARHPQNAVHIELPVSYDNAADRFSAWQADGTLVRDERPLIYVYEQQYRVGDGPLRRSAGFFCRLGLSSDGSPPVRPHEHTLARAKEDRFALLKAVRANLSPVVLVWQAPRDVGAAELIAELTAGPPEVEAVDDAGVRHQLWPVNPASSPTAARLLAAAAAAPLTIADGHHRFATAQRYCAEVGGAGTDFVMAVLFEAGSAPAVLPTHRTVKLDPAHGGSVDVVARARAHFEANLVSSPAAALPAAVGEIGLWTREGGALMSARSPIGASLVDRLDVSVLSAAYPALTGETTAELTAAGRIGYTQDPGAAVAAVDDGRADAAFLLAATPLTDILDVAAAGAVMPAKSTFFYPKAATGLVFNVLAA